MVTDILDRLEWYQSLHSRWQTVIDILDRSLPYEASDGDHLTDSIPYRVQTYRTTAGGQREVASSNQLIVLLEGQELFSIQDDEHLGLVTFFTEGRFIYLQSGEAMKWGQHANEESEVRKVTFFLP